MFEINAKAVYPAHGVGVIQKIETFQMEGQDYQFYVLKILDQGMTIRVPVENAENVGMRTVIEEGKIEEVFEVLKDREVTADKQTWNRRYREYMNKIKTGDPLEVAAVLRDLALLKLEKTLSFGERKMYDQAYGLIVQEIAVARDTDEDAVKEEVDIIFQPES
jgi:CarD family transcriptional regulator